jgi:putative cell wall-binding protein
MPGPTGLRHLLVTDTSTGGNILSIRSKRQMMRKVAALAVTAVFASLLALATPAGAQTPVSPTTNRIHGADRYATAVALARSINSVSDGLIIASGNSSADALAAATVATANRPVLLVPKDSIPESVSDFISDYKGSLAAAAAAKIYFVGGTEAISAANYTALVSLMTTAGDLTPPTFSRLSGADRYATAAAIYAKGPATAAEKLIVVSGESWADGISAAALSAESGYPVVLQTKNGNNASAKATIDSYLALPASVKQFILVGGEASLSTDTEEYLINTKGVAVANIRRIWGADRYATSLNVNLYMDAQNIGGVDLVQVALASGESPWDALAASSWAAAKDAAVQLSPAAGGNASVAALGARVGALSKAGAVTATESVGDTLYLIGGKTALANAARDGFRAGAANNLTSTLTGCVEGGKTMVLTLSGALSDAENTAAVDANEGFEDLITLNAAAAHADTTVTKLAAGVYVVNMANAALAITNGVPDTVKFKGVTEDVAFGGDSDVFERSIGSSSCTIVNDVVRPTATMTGYAGTLDNDNGDTAGNPYWILTTSEAVALDVPAIGEMTCDGATNNRAMVKIQLDAAQHGIAGAGKQWLITTGGGTGATETGLVDAKTAAGDVCSLAAAAMPDLGGNVPAAAVSTTQKAADATGPTLTVSSVACVNTTDQTDLTRGNLTISATSTGAYTGATGNSWKMTVVQQRGILQPDITVDSTAKMITVTGDTGYHTANDVAARWASLNLGANWAVAANTGLISATLTPAVSIAGQSTCTVTVLLNEPGTIGSGGNVSVAGLDAGYVGDPACATGFDGTVCVAYAAADINAEMSMTHKWTFTTKAVGLGSLSLAAGAQGLTNPSADVGVTPVTFTVPG